MAGGPFGCANENGLENCMYYPDKVNLNVLEKDSKTLQSSKMIEPLQDLKDSKVWMYSGNKDEVIVQGNVDHAHQFYVDNGVKDITYNNVTPAVHSFPSTCPIAPKDCSAYNI